MTLRVAPPLVRKQMRGGSCRTGQCYPKEGLLSGRIEREEGHKWVEFGPERGCALDG